MTLVAELWFPGDPKQLPLNNQWLRWTNRYAKAALVKDLRKQATNLAGDGIVAGTVHPTTKPVTIVAQLEQPTARRTDADAIAISVKHFLDGIVQAGVMPDDHGQHVESVTYLAPVKTGVRGVRIWISTNQPNQQET